MKKLICIFLLLNSLYARAESHGSFDIRQPVSNFQVGDDASKKSQGFIHGHCEIVADAGNPMNSPCVGVALILRDNKGNELLRARTQKNGEFGFGVTVSDTRTKYSISASSRFYEVVSPKGGIVPGKEVELELQQRKGVK